MSIFGRDVFEEKLTNKNLILYHKQINKKIKIFKYVSEII